MIFNILFSSSAQIAHTQIRAEITRVIKAFDEVNQTGISVSQDFLLYVLGKDIAGVNIETKMDLWYTVGQLVNSMYEETIPERCGVG